MANDRSENFGEANRKTRRGNSVVQVLFFLRFLPLHRNRDKMIVECSSRLHDVSMRDVYDDVIFT